MTVIPVIAAVLDAQDAQAARNLAAARRDLDLIAEHLKNRTQQ